MGGFILAIVFLVLFFALFAVMAVFGFIRSVFSFGKRTNQKQNNAPQDFTQHTQKTKIFHKQEGEYVDFEEIKEK